MARASILIVDDEKNILSTLSRALRVEDFERARQAYERATALDEDPEIFNRLAALILRLGGDPARAATLWQRSLELDPEQPHVREALDALRAIAPR